MKTLKKPKLSDAPMAITSDGIAINLTHLDRMSDVVAAVERLVPSGQQVFVGLVVRGQLHGNLLKELDDSLADVAGRVGVKLTEASPSPPGRRPKAPR